ncbi:MAG: hypothetical protein COA78_07040 [Blastopirellula sp.]|nr:MAG: hypothetical protein COA78_07040 [Blastopirellula sp.]
MAKVIPDAILDLMLAELDGDAIHVCSAQPATYAEANATYMLAQDVLGGGNYADANGDTSGRKTTLTAPTDSAIDFTGTATHIAITKGTTLLAVTTCTGQLLTAGGTVTIAAFDIELGDAT